MRLAELAGKLAKSIDYEDVWCAMWQPFLCFMNVGNDRSANFNRGREYWTTPVCDFSIPVDKGSDGKWPVLAAGDLARAANLINVAHSSKALFDLYDETTFLERFSRAPSTYGADRLLLGSSAIVGLSRGREQVVHTTDEGAATRSVIANVLDYGFDPKEGYTEFGELLTAAGALAHSEGCTHRRPLGRSFHCVV